MANVSKAILRAWVCLQLGIPIEKIYPSLKNTLSQSYTKLSPPLRIRIETKRGNFLGESAPSFISNIKTNVLPTPRQESLTILYWEASQSYLLPNRFMNPPLLKQLSIVVSSYRSRMNHTKNCWTDPTTH